MQREQKPIIEMDEGGGGGEKLAHLLLGRDVEY
jgi:hypothetical protein